MCRYEQLSLSTSLIALGGGVTIRLLALLDSFYDRLKSPRFINRKFAQYLAVESDVGILEASDKSTVRCSMEARTGIYTGVPQLSKCSFVVSSIAVGKLQGLGNGLFAPLDA